MLTVHMLTKNNESTVERSLDSLKQLNCKVLIGDMGSSDETIEICKRWGATIYRLNGQNRSDARNWLISQEQNGPQMLVEPWDALISGHDYLEDVKPGAYYVTLCHNKNITKEIRVWNGNYRFVNPVYEKLDAETDKELNVVFYSKNGLPNDEVIPLLKEWMEDDPLSSSPYYYQSCILLSQGKWDEYLRMAEHYLFLEKTDAMSAIMTRYYYAYVQLVHKRSVRPALQNLNLCLCANPLMAEFWCLTGDVYYHLLHKFKEAIEFYENAQILGSRRLRSDKWPIDITKYNEYPKKMIESCQKIMESQTIYAPQA